MFTRFALGIDLGSSLPRTLRLPALAAGAVLFVGALQPAMAQDTAAEILRTSVDRHEARVADVENFTVLEEIDGTERLVYYERREVDGRTTFVARDPIALGLQSGRFDEALGARAPEGGVMESVRDAMLDAVARAGLDEVERALHASGEDELAEFVSPLLATMRTEEGGVSFAALEDTELLREALIEGAKRAGMEFAISQISRAALGEFAPVVDVLRGKAEPGEILGMLGGTLAGGDLAGLGRAMGAGADPAGGPGADASGAGGRILSGVARAGLGALARHGAQALAGAAMDGLAHGGPGGAMELDVYGMMADLETTAALTGTEVLDGRETWILTVDDLSRLDIEADQMRDARLRMWWDRELYVPLQVEMTGEVESPEGWLSITVRSQLERYEETDGVLLPRRTTTRIEGMDAGIPEEERAEMRERMAEMEEQMAQMEEQMAQMPEQQRAMVEQMMAERMPQMEAMLGGESMELVTVVKRVRVNEGPPDG